MYDGSGELDVWSLVNYHKCEHFYPMPVGLTDYGYSDGWKPLPLNLWEKVKSGEYDEDVAESYAKVQEEESKRAEKASRIAAYNESNKNKHLAEIYSSSHSTLEKLLRREHVAVQFEGDQVEQLAVLVPVADVRGILKDVDASQKRIHQKARDLAISASVPTPTGSSGLVQPIQSALPIPELKSTDTVCPLCFVSLATNLSCRRHLKAHYGLHDYRCAVCNQGCKDLQALRKHNERHDQMKAWHCQPCDLYYFSNSELQTHMNREHRRYQPDDMVCPHCKKQFMKIATYKEHVPECRMNPQYPGPYYCPVDCCPRCLEGVEFPDGFRRKKEFNKHMRKFHPEVKVFKPVTKPKVPRYVSVGASTASISC